MRARSGSKFVRISSVSTAASIGVEIIRIGGSGAGVALGLMATGGIYSRFWELATL